jgi:hypothetical protein
MNPVPRRAAPGTARAPEDPAGAPSHGHGWLWYPNRRSLNRWRAVTLTSFFEEETHADQSR